MKSRSLLNLVAAFAVALTLLPSLSNANAPDLRGHDHGDSGRPEITQGRLMVKFTSQAMPQISESVLQKGNGALTGIASLDALGRAAGVSSITKLHQGTMKRPDLDAQIGLSRWHVLEIDAGVDVWAIAAEYAADPNVEYAEPEYLYYPQVVPNDPMYASQWGHNNTAQMLDYCWGCGGHPAGSPVGTVGFDADAQQAWNSGYGSAGVLIAIIDSGVETTHADLRIYNNPGEVLNGIDDDLNGLIDDTQGWDFADGDRNANDTTPTSLPNGYRAGHGTACAGVAAARANNALGVAGAAGGCTVLPLKTIPDGTGTGSLTGAAIQASIRYAGDQGADVISMSFGRSCCFSVGESNAVDYAYAAGSMLLAATGNSNSSAISYPAQLAKVMGVGAASPCGDRKRSSSNSGEVNPGVSTDPNGYTCDGERWWGSSYGVNAQDAADAVDVIAPTIMPTTDLAGVRGYDPGSYSMWFNGTSCATPYAAGVAALIKSANPGFTNVQLWNQLTGTCTDIVNVESGAGWDRYSGYGMVNSGLAVGLPDWTFASPAGWYDHIVPREFNNSNFGSVPAPVVLPGDLAGGSFSNMNVRNVGSAAATGVRMHGFLDGVHYVVGSSGVVYNPGANAWFGNFAFTATGGRHTFEGLVDPNDTEAESDETNNAYARQYVWTPVDMTPQTQYTRAAAPDGTAGWAALSASGNPAGFNTDGLGFPRNVGVGFWRGVGVHAQSNLEDFDVALLNPTSSIHVGQDNASWTGIQSLLPAGLTDIVLINDNNYAQNNEIAMFNQDGSATGNDIIEDRRSIFPEYNAMAGAVETVSMGSHQMLFLREFDSVDATQVTVVAQVHGAVQPATLSIFDHTFILGDITDAAFQAVTDATGKAVITLPTDDFQFYGIAVHRDPIDGTAPMNVTIKIRPPVNGTAVHNVVAGYSLFNAPADLGKPFPEAQSWDGIVGNPPVTVDGTIIVQLFNAAGNAMVGFPAEDIRLVTGGTFPCRLGNTTDSATDASGTAFFKNPLGSGGAGFATSVQILDVPSASISHSGGLVSFNSADIDGDLVVGLVDVGLFASDFLGYDYRSDFFWDGIMGLQDVGLLATVIGASCPPPPPGPPPVGELLAGKVANHIGVYFDRDGERRSASLEPGEPITAYVMLTGVGAHKGISAWEASLSGSSNVIIESVTLAGEAINVGSGDDYVVGTGQVLSAAEGRPVRLATLSLRVRDDRPAHLYVGASSLNSMALEMPAIVVAGDEASLEVAAAVSNNVDAPVAYINDGSAPEVGEPVAHAFRGYELRNYPNPFNPATEINFSLPKQGLAEVRIYDVSGRQVRAIQGGSLPAGENTLRWNGTDDRGTGVVSGTYYYRLFVDGQNVGKGQRMVLVK